MKIAVRMAGISAEVRKPTLSSENRISLLLGEGMVLFAVISKHSTHYTACRRVRKISKSVYKLRHVCLSVRMEHLSSHSTDFHEM